MPPKVAPQQRARSAAQKSDRREAILVAAEAQFRYSGFEAFSMATLARDAGVAKGTLYLYFKTREEVLLELYKRQLTNWCGRLAAALHSGMEDLEIVEAFFRTAREDPVFLQLVARLDSVIEHNVSLDQLIAAKRLMISQFAALSPALEDCLALDAGSVFEVLQTFAALLLGAQQSDAGPALAAESLPRDVRELVDSFSAEGIFIPGALGILAGIRERAAARD